MCHNLRPPGQTLPMAVKGMDYAMRDMTRRYHAGRRNGKKYNVGKYGETKGRLASNCVVRKRLSPEAREIFLEGLRRYRERGVRILLDGKDVEIDGLEVIFEERLDGSFYMGDYVLEEAAVSECRNEECCLEVRESQAEYGNSAEECRRRCLKEIRFDRVYNR